MSKTTRLLEDTPATVIPAGQAVILSAGDGVHIVQTLGGNVTVRTDRGLYRIAREHAGAIAGLDLADLEQESAGQAAAGVEFSEDLAWDALRACFDPEIPVNIVDLGLIYDLAVEERPQGRLVEVKMTLTAPGCGMGPVIAEDARQRLAALPGVAEAKVYIVWDPQWTPQMISPAGRKQLGID